MLFRFQFQLFHTFQIHKHGNLLKDVIWIPFGFVVSGSVFVYGWFLCFLIWLLIYFLIFTFFYPLYSLAENMVR